MGVTIVVGSSQDMREAPTREKGPLHAYLSGNGFDHRGRLVTDVIRFSDSAMDTEVEFAEWLFPLVRTEPPWPGGPTLADHDVEILRRDPMVRWHVMAGCERALRFYGQTARWLRPVDPHHRRITRIIASVHLLIDFSIAANVHDAIQRRVQEAGNPVNGRSQMEWLSARQGRIL
jgi:hypothetical protein